MSHTRQVIENINLIYFDIKDEFDNVFEFQLSGEIKKMRERHVCLELHIPSHHLLPYSVYDRKAQSFEHKGLGYTNYLYLY